MPRADPTGGKHPSRSVASARVHRLLNNTRRRRRRDKDLDDGGVPVEPDRPKTLDGGAAAQLDFDDETQ